VSIALNSGIAVREWLPDGIELDRARVFDTALDLLAESADPRGRRAR
jgi:hypothetical protein